MLTALSQEQINHVNRLASDEIIFDRWVTKMNLGLLNLKVSLNHITDLM